MKINVDNTVEELQGLLENINPKSNIKAVLIVPENEIDSEECEEPVYGQLSSNDKSYLEEFTSDDFEKDMKSMDLVFYDYIAKVSLDTVEEVGNILYESYKKILANITSYQNTKNERAKIEVLKLIEK